jgi:hypothetical protein
MKMSNIQTFLKCYSDGFGHPFGTVMDSHPNHDPLFLGYHNPAMDKAPKLPARSLRKSPASCPLCGKRLRRNSRATRHLRHCDNCGGTLNKNIECPHCLTFRVWTARSGAVCHGCGKIVRKKSKPI